MAHPTFREFSSINRERAAMWHQGGEPWSLADWSNALAGEVGELANFVKKIRRLETGTGGRISEQDRTVLTVSALKEVADVYLYLDLVAEQLDPQLTMDQIISVKFNITSSTFGFPHRLREVS